ncbi:transcriptional regulator family: Fungal Specific TF [Purpureocillium lilacinum]|uniref:Transcriptional regulator family: Fungal Specific TF n=1 Tax=Purpureocillium lilacinum TaxID=33203 RepID=A0ABR0BFE9_PURLI|nr:transcriptional regulator family: Fungal Specific TF [Purpureocillium lilacinum]
MDDDDNQDTPERPGVLRQGWKQNGRVTIACTACRTQHLRCDAAQPVCSRCRALNKPCVYTNVRRSRRKVAKVWDSSPSEPRARHEDVHDGIQTTDIRDVAIPTQQGPSNPPHRRTGASSAPFVPNCSVEASSAIDGFYSYFFPGHPFVLPRTSFISQVDRDPASVADLLPAMALVGSLYLRDGRSSSYRQGVEQALCQQLPPTGFSVQALMLFALVLEWSGENERAESTLGQAKSLALSIQMNQKPFATRHGQGIPVMEECWRRTWWELYVIDALFAGIRHQPTFDLWNVDTDVDLPGEEADYIEANIASPRTLTEYEDRGFDQVDVPFSSFAYLVDAARILGTTLAAGDVAGGSPVALVKNAEANIMSWDLHLPQSKRDPVRPNGVAAHLHRPRSLLHYSTMELLCSKYAPPLPAEVLAPEEKHHDRHTHKAIRAAIAFIDLLTVPASATSHSPFVMCMGSMAMATHMSACELLLRGDDYAHARDRVRVFLGILRAFEGVWPQACKWSGEMRLMAKAVFANRDRDGNLISDPLGALTQSLGDGFQGVRVEDLGTGSSGDDLDMLLTDASFGETII